MELSKTQIYAIIVVIIVIVAVCAVAVVATGDDDSDDDDDGSSETVYGTITDAAGNEITLTGSETRIVSVTVTAAEMVCDLGLRSYLVGATTDSGIYSVDSEVIGISMDLDYPATIEEDIESGTITDVGTYYGWTAESVSAANPDIVIMDYGQISSDASRMEQLQELGVICIVLYDESGIDCICQNYEMLGTAFGVSDVAEELTSQIVAVSDAIYNAVSGASTELTVAHICYCYGYYYIYNSSSTLDVLLNLGATNALPTDSSYAVITVEDIAAADPDLIIFDDMATGLDWDEVIEEWKADSVMGSISAIANDSFFCLEYDPFQATSYDTVHFVEGIALVATLLYSDYLGVDVPTVITDDDWKSYIQWVADLV